MAKMMKMLVHSQILEHKCIGSTKYKLMLYSIERAINLQLMKHDTSIAMIKTSPMPTEVLQLPTVTPSLTTLHDDGVEPAQAHNASVHPVNYAEIQKGSKAGLKMQPCSVLKRAIPDLASFPGWPTCGIL